MPAALEDATPSWALGEPVLLLGASESAPGHQFARIAGAVRTARGLTVVADGASNQLRAFDSAGGVAWIRGGAGAGPEEFQGMSGLWFAGPDTIIAYDVPSQRISYWSDAGEYQRAIQLRLDFIPRLMGRLADGSFIANRPDRSRTMSPGTTRLDSITVYRITSEGDSAAFLGRFPASTTFATAVPSLGGRTLYTTAPLSPTDISAVGPDYVWIGHGSGWTLRKFGFDGVILDSIVVPGQRQVLTDHHRQAWLAEAVARGRPEQRGEMQRHFEAFPMPEFLSTHDELAIGAHESVWARRGVGPGADSAIWDVYGVDGCWLGALFMRAGTRPTQITRQFLTATSAGQDEVELVGVYALPEALGR